MSSPKLNLLSQTRPGYNYQANGQSHPKAFYQRLLMRVGSFFSIPSEELSHYDGTVGRKGYYNYRFLIK